jgi:hypothetical protein
MLILAAKCRNLRAACARKCLIKPVSIRGGFSEQSDMNCANIRYPSRFYLLPTESGGLRE